MEGTVSRGQAAVEVLRDDVLGGEGVAAVGARDGGVGAVVCIWAAGGAVGAREEGEGDSAVAILQKSMLLFPYSRIGPS